MPAPQAPFDSNQTPKLTIAALEELVGELAPFVALYGFKVDEIGFGWARVRLPYDDNHVRPGGTISGPAMMALADYAMYVGLMGAIGPVALAVTTNLNINFLHKPAERDLLCDARLIKLGKRLAVGDMSIHPEGDERMCAHVTATYSIPPQ